MASSQVRSEPRSAESKACSIHASVNFPSAHRQLSSQRPRPADLLTMTHSLQVQKEKPGGLVRVGQPLPRKRGHSMGTGGAATGDTGRPQQQLIVRAREQEQEDIVPAPQPQPYLIAFQPTHELFFNSSLFSLQRLLTQKFSKFPIISRREETQKQNLR